MPVIRRIAESVSHGTSGGGTTLSRVQGRPTERQEATDTGRVGRLTNLTEAELLELKAKLEAKGKVVPETCSRNADLAVSATG